MEAIQQNAAVSGQKAARGLDGRTAFAAIVVLRSLFFAFFVFTIDHLIDLGTSPWAVSAGAVAGLVAASYLAFTPLTHRGFFTGCAALLLCNAAFFSLAQRLPPPATAIFGVYVVQQHATLILLALCAAGAATWFFWRFRHALTIEFIVLCGVFVSLLASHRNYHFDTLSLVNEMAWRYGMNQLAMLVVLGAGIFVVLAAYFVVTTLPGKPQPQARAAVLVHHAAGNRIAGSIMLLLSLAVLWLVAYETYTHHYQISLTMIRNGVGEENREGLSPLDFRSALGTSNQPAGLVRLEGDYTDNPFTPMLYLREAALSAFNGEAMIIGKRDLDDDVSFTTPEQPYDTQEKPDQGYRVPLEQSIYLLTKHKSAFAVDYPIRIRQLKLPDKTDKFKGAFRAQSLAPAFALPDLVQAAVGNPAWSEETRRYYLTTHPDSRYKEFAEKITAGAETPVAKANAIIAYLNQHAIYTLSPNHEQKEGEDPVAPFLFGDMRGYCVHFAHAITYMLRALGIPARIATGYLTDMSQAKDGHILLRMSDRHAWAEAYVEGRGWIPFDVQPEKVESHAESPVDMKVLEELMGLLGPGEEILPDETKGETGIEEEHEYYTPTAGDGAIAVGVVLLVLALAKLALLFGWRLFRNPRRRLNRGYAAMLAWLHDMGIRRQYGETREEFRQRASAQIGAPVLELTEAINAVRFGAPGAASVKTPEVNALMRNECHALATIPLHRRILALCNPSSLLLRLGSMKW